MQAQYKTYDSYKDSGVPWLGGVPTHWVEKPFFAVAKQKSIKNQAHLDLLSVYLNMGVVKFSDVEEKRTNATSEDLTSYQKVDVGDLVLNNQQAWRGSVGVSEYQGIVSPAYLVAQLDKIINARFANYLFRDSNMVAHYLISSKGVGTIQRNLYWDKLKRVPVFVPSIEEQERIVAFLDQKTAEIDAAIEKKQRLIELLKEQKSILINQAVTKGLKPSAPMKDSGIEWIGQIPAHWQMKRLKNHGRLKGGAGFPVELQGHEGNELSFYKVKHLSTGNSLEANRADDTISRKTASALGAYIFPEKTIVFAKVGAALMLSRFRFLPVAGCIDNNMMGIITNPLVSFPQYLAAYLNTIDVTYFASLGTVPSINEGQASPIPIPTPPLSEQQEIAIFVNKISTQLLDVFSATEAEIEKLQEFKQTLIAHAVTGKIKV